MPASIITRTCQRQIRFTDPDLESANVIERFVDLLLEAGLSTSSLMSLNVATAVGLVRFLQKYECGQLLRLALACLHHGFTTSATKSWVVFMAACVAQDEDIVASMLNDRRHGGWKREGAGRVGDDLTLDIDVRGYPYEWWTMMPSKYAYAVGKAITYSEKYPDSKRTRGDVFRELVMTPKV